MTEMLTDEITYMQYMFAIELKNNIWKEAIRPVIMKSYCHY